LHGRLHGRLHRRPRSKSPHAQAWARPAVPAAALFLRWPAQNRRAFTGWDLSQALELYRRERFASLPPAQAPGHAPGHSMARSLRKTRSRAEKPSRPEAEDAVRVLLRWA
jgi:hypothetical protein